MPFPLNEFPNLGDEDLVYGLGWTRLAYRQDRAEFSNYTNINTIDSFVINHGEEKFFESTGLPVQSRNTSFMAYLENHSKYNSICAETGLYFGGNVYYRDILTVLGRKCKAGLLWASDNDIHTHFILDDIDMDEVVDKKIRIDRINLTSGTSITSRELRLVYRNRNNAKIQNNVQFWKDGKRASPPWQSDPETWSRYKPKSEADGAKGTIKAAAEIEHTAVQTITDWENDGFEYLI